MLLTEIVKLSGSTPVACSDCFSAFLRSWVVLFGIDQQFFQLTNTYDLRRFTALQVAQLAERA